MFDFVNKLLKRPTIRNRRYVRTPVEARAELYFTERRYGIVGMVMELSRGGALFREASKFIMDRKLAAVILRVGGHEFAGVIVNVRPVGYGILFDEPLSEDTIAEIATTSAEAS